MLVVSHSIQDDDDKSNDKDDGADDKLEIIHNQSIRIFQLYQNSVIRTCIASERIITIIT